MGMIMLCHADRSARRRPWPPTCGGGSRPGSGLPTRRCRRRPPWPGTTACRSPPSHGCSAPWPPRAWSARFRGGGPSAPRKGAPDRGLIPAGHLRSGGSLRALQPAEVRGRRPRAGGAGVDRGAVRPGRMCPLAAGTGPGRPRGGGRHPAAVHRPGSRGEPGHRCLAGRRSLAVLRPAAAGHRCAGPAVPAGTAGGPPHLLPGDSS